MGTILYADGRTEERAPANGREWTLDELHAIVGGWIEQLPCKDGRIMTLNEDGKNIGLPVNQAATDLVDLPSPRQTYLAAAALKKSNLRVVIMGTPEEYGTVVGDVLVCNKSEMGEA